MSSLSPGLKVGAPSDFHSAKFDSIEAILHLLHWFQASWDDTANLAAVSERCDRSTEGRQMQPLLLWSFCHAPDSWRL